MDDLIFVTNTLDTRVPRLARTVVGDSTFTFTKINNDLIDRFIVGEPLASGKYTSEELGNMGYIGLYRLPTG